MQHRWKQATFTHGAGECRECGIVSYWGDEPTPECGAAWHPDRAINRLYRQRRRAAELANTDGRGASRGWAELERITRELTRLDPKGDWYYEGDRYDGLGWRVTRP